MHMLSYCWNIYMDKYIEWNELITEGLIDDQV